MSIHRYLFQKLSTPWLVLPLLAVLLRYFSFFPAVINHDESTYIVIARDLLHGKHYFVDLIDTKPIGIFLIYAIFQILVGKSIFMYRLLTALWIGMTAAGLFHIGKRHLGGSTVGWGAGISYLLMTSVYTYYGVSPNTELFFNGFTVLALWWVLGGKSWWRYALAGVSLGIGFIVKYVVAFDALAFGLLTLWLAQQRKEAWYKGLGRGLVMAVSFMLPLLLVFQYYRLLGHEAELLYYTFVAPTRYPVEHKGWTMVVFYLDFLLRYLPITLLAGLALWSGRLGKLRWFFVIWILLIGLAVGWPGKAFGHYFIQMMPPFCLLAGIGLRYGKRYFQWWHRLSLAQRSGILAILLVGWLWLQKKDYYDKWDHQREIAAYLSERLSAGDQLYTGNYHQLLYFLLDQETPTPYLHRSLLWDAHHVDALEIDLQQETEHILALRPRFLLLEEPVPDNILAESLYPYYRPIKTFRDRITVYELR